MLFTDPRLPPKRPRHSTRRLNVAPTIIHAALTATARGAHRAGMTDRLDLVFAALADPTRRAILAMLLEDDMAVTDVAAGFGISLAAVSRHLGVLAGAGLIAREKRGRVVWCKLEPDALRPAGVWMQAFGRFDGPDLDRLETLLAGLATQQSPDLLETLLASERAVWAALRRGDAEADRAALHSTFLGVYPSGRAGRDDHAAQLEDGPSVEEWEIEAPVAMPLGPDHGLLSYIATFRRPGGPTTRMAVSSVWGRDGDGWVNLFSQDTPLDDQPAG